VRWFDSPATGYTLVARKVRRTIHESSFDMEYGIGGILILILIILAIIYFAKRV
jgi:hypothetical protein